MASSQTGMYVISMYLNGDSHVQYNQAAQSLSLTATLRIGPTLLDPPDEHPMSARHHQTRQTLERERLAKETRRNRAQMKTVLSEWIAH